MKKILLPCLLMNLVHADISQVANTLTAATEASDTLNAATMGLYGTMTHGEIETGKGTMSMTGGFLGLNGKISDDVTTYTLKNEHQNIFAKPLNYGYKISWFDSDKINQAASTYNQSITTINTNIPAMDYKIRGLDADIGLGWDLINHGSHDYLSFGVDIGLSVPYIQSTKSSNTSNSGNLNTMVPLDEKGNTNIWTYKVGPQIKASKSLTSYLSLYGSAIYDYQYASVKNTSVGLNSKVDGTFIESEMGIRYQPLERKYQITSWFSLSPQLYFTTGIRYNKWSFNDVAINVFNQSIPFPKSNLSISSTSTYLGIGYSF